MRTNKHTEFPLQSIISVVKLLRTPDSVRTGGAFIGAFKVLLACFHNIRKDKENWNRMCIGIKGEWYRREIGRGNKIRKQVAMLIILILLVIVLLIRFQICYMLSLGYKGSRSRRSKSKSKSKKGNRDLNRDSGQHWDRDQDQVGSQWLWLVRSCFDRRAVVRLIALEHIYIVLQETSGAPDVSGWEEEKRTENTFERGGDVLNEDDEEEDEEERDEEGK